MIRTVLNVFTLASAMFFFCGFNENFRRERSSQAAATSDQIPEVFEGVTIEEQLGKKIDLNLSFKNSQDEVVTFGDLLKDGKPILMTLNYYRCTTLCAIQILALVEMLNNLQKDDSLRGKFKVVSLSFDPIDTPAIAAEKKREYMRLIENTEGLDWSFLVGESAAIESMTKSVGFYYHYDKETNEFAHAAASFFIGANGIISRYLYGIAYPIRDVKFALIEASKNRIGSTTDRILLNCFHYNPGTGRYEGVAIGSLRIMAVVTIILVVGLLWFFLRRERRKKAL